MGPKSNDPADRPAQHAVDAGAATDTVTVEQTPEQAKGPDPPRAEPQGSVLSDIGREDNADGGAKPPSGHSPAVDSQSIHMLMDVDLTVTAELGRTRMTIGEIISLSAGSIIALSKNAGETVDLRINDKLLASGEVIVVDGHFAVKITKLLSKEERVKSFS